MTEINNETLPRLWLKPDGSILPDEQIKTISKDWSAETWEQFLTETVDQSAYQKESVTFVKESYFDRFSETIWESQDTDQMDEIAKELRRICRDHLTPQQQHIIRSTFWNGFSERKISELLGISRSTVQAQKIRALGKIKQKVITQKLLQGGRQKNLKASSLQRLTKSNLVKKNISERVVQDLLTTSNAEATEHIYKHEIEKPHFVFKTGGDL